MVFNGESNENSGCCQEEEDDDVLFNRLDREEQEWCSNGGRGERETMGDDEQWSLLDTDTEG